MQTDINERQLVTVEQEMATAATLYGAEKDILEFAHAVKNFAPWAEKMQNKNISLVVRRSLAMGLDPLNPHEVQIWVDNRNKVQFQLAYTLMTQWVKHFKGDHTEPQYDALTEAEKEIEGLDADCMAFYCRFIMKDDIARIKDLLDVGFSPREARDALTVTGVGVATPDEISGKFFAPAARSAAWKVKKRALVDAYRRKFGTPTRPDIMELRRVRGEHGITLEDWRVVAEEPEEVRAEAAIMHAHAREGGDDGRTPEEILARNRELLRGSGEDILEGEVEEVAPQLQAAETEDEWQPPEADRPESTNPEIVKESLRKQAGWTRTKTGWRREKADKAEPAPDKAIQRCAAVLGKAVQALYPDKNDAERDMLRHSMLNFLWKKTSTHDLTMREVGATNTRFAVGGRWEPTEQAVADIGAILRAAMVDAGQTEMEV
jgi:hypothetical protein